jgi:hypothetical protein
MSLSRSLSLSFSLSLSLFLSLYLYIHPSIHLPRRYNPSRVLANSSNRLQPSLSLALINPQTPPGSSPFHTSGAHTLSFRNKRFFQG